SAPLSSPVSLLLLLFLRLRPPPTSTLFPYTTLFRSSVRDALAASHHALLAHGWAVEAVRRASPGAEIGIVVDPWPIHPASEDSRSEEHTSELQSLTNLVCRLLLEKKKTTALACHAPC